MINKDPCRQKISSTVVKTVVTRDFFSFSASLSAAFLHKQTFLPGDSSMNDFCHCLNPQSCWCYTSQPVHQQGKYHLGYLQTTSFRTPSRAHMVPSSHSPFTPCPRGAMQCHETGAYNSRSSHNPITFYDNHHARNTFPSPHHNIVPSLTPMRPSMHPQGVQQPVPGYPSVSPVTLNRHLPST